MFKQTIDQLIGREPRCPALAKRALCRVGDPFDKAVLHPETNPPGSHCLVDLGTPEPMRCAFQQQLGEQHGIFLPRTDAELPNGERQRIGSIYQGKPWRALVHGRNGTWHAVAGAPSEAAAIEAAMKSCGQADVDCRLFAIGNFRVADDK